MTSARTFGLAQLRWLLPARCAALVLGLQAFAHPLCLPPPACLHCRRRPSGAAVLTVRLLLTLVAVAVVRATTAEVVMPLEGAQVAHL
jgi:hypothetical protein